MQPIKLILNIFQIIGTYSWYAKLKYYKLQLIKLSFIIFLGFNSDVFRLTVPKIGKMVPWFLADVHKDGLTFNKYNNTVLKMVY